MAQSKNFKIGGGSFTPGKSVVNNNLGRWTNTGDPIKLKDLIDKPNYFAKKLLDKEIKQYYKTQRANGVPEEDITPPLPLSVLDSALYRKENEFIPLENDSDFTSKEVKNINSFRDPKKGYDTYVNKDVPQMDTAEKIQQTVDDMDTKAFSQFSVDLEPYSKYVNATYQLKWTNPDTQEEKTSRPIKYWYTTEELQYVVDNDLISGISGYNISSLGNISKQFYGPFSFQARSKGHRDFFEIIDSDPSNVFQSLSHGYSDDDSYANYNLRFEPQKVPAISGRVFIKNRKYYKNQIGSLNLGHITPLISSYSPTLGASLKANNISGLIPLPKVIPGLEKAWPRYEIINLEPTSGQKAFQYYNHATTTVLAPNYNFLFKDAPEPDLPQKDLYLTGISASIQPVDLPHNNSPIPEHFPLSIKANGNEYNDQNYFAWGAPGKFISHSIVGPYEISIKNCDTITGFRIPVQNYLTTANTLNNLEITDCNNLTFFSAPSTAFNSCSGINLSGCKIDTFNMYHHYNKNNIGFRVAVDKNGNKIQNEKGEYLSVVPENKVHHYPHNLEIPFPKDMTVSFHETDVLDPPDYIDKPLETAYVAAAFLGTKIKYINLNGNSLNQTGCLAVIQSAVNSIFSSNRDERILDIRNQTPRNGPQAAIFSGPRGDLYNSLVKCPITNFAIKDVNDQCLSGIEALKRRGWTVLYDSE